MYLSMNHCNLPLLCIVALFCVLLPTVTQDFNVEGIIRTKQISEVAKSISGTKFLNYIPGDHIESVQLFNETIDWEGVECRVHGRWNEVDDHPKNPFIYPPEMRVFTVKIGVLTDMYVNRAAGICTKEYFIVPSNVTWFYNQRGQGSGTVIASYENAIVFGHAYNYQYGHWFLDYLAPLMLLPLKIVKTYKLLNIPNIAGAHETLDFLGVPKENRIAPPGYGQLIHCDRLYYAWDPLPQTAYYGPPLKLIKKLVHDALGLDGIPTTRYVCYNREARRKILNFDQMVNSLKSNFPEYNWETIRDHMSLAECGKIFASIKLIISGNGSHYFRCFAMNKGSVAVEVLGIFHDISCMCALMSSGAHVISLQHPGINHAMWWGGANYNMEIDKIVKIVKYLQPYLKGGQFPKGDPLQ